MGNSKKRNIDRNKLSYVLFMCRIVLSIFHEFFLLHLKVCFSYLDINTAE